MKNKVIILALALIILFGAWQLLPERKKAPTDQFTEIVSTSMGDVRGFVQDGLNVYLGIPYAEAPSGSRRYKTPEPKQKWDGVFEAYEFGPVCPQVYDPVELDDPNEKVNVQDCLTLNIWSPSASTAKSLTCGGANSSTMIVIMMASTPSLNASSRPLFIFSC